MKSILMAVLLSAFATAAHAQGTATETCADPYVEAVRQAAAARDTDALHKLYDQTRLVAHSGATAERLDARFLGASCARIESTISGINVLEKSLDQVEAEEAIAGQDKAGLDLVNGAQRAIQSGKRADVIAGLETIRNYLANAENAFSGKSLSACNSPGASIRWNQPPCDPVPYIKRGIDREFNRHGWPVAASPSAAYTWLISQYRDGPPNGQRDIVNFASGNSIDLLSQNLLAKVEQMNRAQLAANAVQQRHDAREARISHDAGLVGNFTSMGDRLWRALSSLGSSFLAVFLVVAILGYMPFLRAFFPSHKVQRGLMLLWITTIPFYAVYVVFGGWLEPLGRMLPGWVRWPLMLAVYVPACVLVQRSRWYSALYARLPAFLRGMTAAPVAAATVGPVAGGGLHGSAHWSNTQAGIQGGRYQPAGHVLADSHGFTLGRAPDHADKAMNGFDSRLRYMGHVLTVAPNGSGKGIGAVIPALLDYPGSTIVLDVKGENYAVTSRFRRDQLGHEVFLVDPFGVTGQPSHCLNWLDRLDPDSPDVVGESATLADMLVVSEGHASEATAHFNETAKSLIRGLMVHVATLPPEQRNMGEVRRLLMLGGADFDVVLAQMIANPRGYDLPARAANAFNDAPDKERGSILSTARRHLAFLDDPRIVAALSRSDFSPDDLKARKITVYLVMPPARLSANRAFVRAFFGQAINAVMASAGKPPYRVLFLLDEFPQLGRMDIVEEKLPLIRGYGGAFWLVAQNLDQLKETYPRWQNFVANCGAKQFFGTADVETARYVSDSLGRMTVEFQTANTSTSAGQSFSSGSGVSQQFTGRELLTADEVMRLPREHEIVLINGEAPWLLTRLNYLTDPEYAGRFDANPYE
ncbi:type IV secretory system conjugative DNA transfer family protein [Pseudomonas aeruginosa]|uniref:type IV secretory system conjugative DNA transfer family protein n=1 Tax=Pseudomonas aeruginosa TaxID=287 RepID=UPI001CD47317|nr:type IV secretory system conjugative DNA transfer family protein [Pseudomonas aeruginosa]